MCATHLTAMAIVLALLGGIHALAPGALPAAHHEDLPAPIRTPGVTADALPFRPAERVWHEVREFPETVFQKFLEGRGSNIGYIDIVLDRRRPQDGVVIAMVDIRENTAVAFFRGVPGGIGFAIPDAWPYTGREYVLEIRWLDGRDHRWKVWWSRARLDGSLLDRPGLNPQAHDAPF